MFRSWAILIAVVLALAGCSSVEASTNTTALATPSLPCALPYGTHVALVSPAPGTSGVPAGNAPVLVVASQDLPKTVSIIAVGGKGSATSPNALERIGPPAHVARAPFTDPVYYRAAVTLRAHRHYTLALDDVAQNGCAPYARLTGNARFST